MNLVDTLALFFVSATAGTPVEPPTETISPPTSPSTSRVGGIPGSVQVSWVTGDVDASTRVYVDIASSFYPYITIAPGVTSVGTDLLADQAWDFTLTHVKNDLESVGVAASWAGL